MVLILLKTMKYSDIEVVYPKIDRSRNDNRLKNKKTFLRIGIMFQP